MGLASRITEIPPAVATAGESKRIGPARPRRKSIDPDLAYIEQMRSGDGKGLDLLMSHHAEALHRFIFRYTNNEEDAADIAQETFVRVFRKADKYKPTASVKTWIYTIALNLCRDRARRLARVKWLPFLAASKDDEQGLGPEDTTPDNRPGPLESTSHLELEAAISHQIAALPDNLKAPFVLCVLEGRSQAAAGEVLGLSAKSVEVRIYRARRKLRELLAPILKDFGAPE